MKTKSINIQVREQKKTHVEIMREKYISNQAFILKVTRMSLTEYHNTVLETGLNFLERIYPSNCSIMSEHYKQLAYNKQSGFWKWFLAEFIIAENDYINNIGYPTADNYKEFIAMLHDDVLLQELMYKRIINQQLHVKL